MVRKWTVFRGSDDKTNRDGSDVGERALSTAHENMVRCRAQKKHRTEQKHKSPAQYGPWTTEKYSSAEKNTVQHRKKYSTAQKITDSIKKRSTVLKNTVRHSTVQNSTNKYSTVQYT